MNFNWQNILRLNAKRDSKLHHESPDEQKKIRTQSVTLEQFEKFKLLIKRKSSEAEIHKFLEENQVIFSFALSDYHTGHHGLWVYSKQEIQPRIKSKNTKGLIPDFIIGGENSNGHQWFIIELKGADENIFTIDTAGNIGLSSVANKGICQLIEYTDACCAIQGHLRDHFRMKNFREPVGILIIGAEDELNERKQKLKGALNRNFNKQFEIRTYDWLLRNFEKWMSLGKGYR